MSRGRNFAFRRVLSGRDLALDQTLDDVALRLLDGGDDVLVELAAALARLDRGVDAFQQSGVALVQADGVILVGILGVKDGEAGVVLDKLLSMVSM